ncbi:glycosyltransferase family 4 protein [Vibrio rarus]|uniref:glycosyltransferase family 4 protein n=1 Tax=Vibrio rarus TaxID=413403 RepID=UPI0021C2671A|nr:glycosyltransferase family 4 protein [Vibrio rarus]
MKRNHCIVFDPIPYHGGSKVATQLAMQWTNSHTHYYILSASKHSWQKPHTTHSHTRYFCLPQCLARCTQGQGYWLKQLFLMLYLALFTAYVAISTRCKPVSLLLASGPGVDFAGYVIGHIFALQIIQLIHGPVGKSRATKWCLTQGYPTFYLPAAQSSLRHCLQLTHNQSLPHHLNIFVNGLDDAHYPTLHRFCHTTPQVQFYWAASLLKWKGLDLLLQAHNMTQWQNKSALHICYIRPAVGQAEQSAIDPTLSGVHWYHEPNNLDAIRAQCDVYISTSINEPFGLSTLEALAAGLIVLIPRDGAFWDTQLQDGVHCLKYDSNNANSLNECMQSLTHNLARLQPIAQQGRKIAARYLAKQTYAAICNAIDTAPNKKAMAKRHYHASSSLQKHAQHAHLPPVPSAQHHLKPQQLKKCSPHNTGEQQ